MNPSFPDRIQPEKILPERILPERILVVDDEPNMLGLFKKVLEKEGYEVVTVSTGEEAVKKLGTEWFDLLISDLKMPGLSGLELLKRVKSLVPALPCIMLTAYGSIDSAVAMRPSVWSAASTRYGLMFEAFTACGWPRMSSYS